MSANPTSTPVLDVDGLSHRFRDTEALRDVSFSLYPGELTGLVGPNGAGKSTLLQLLSGLLDVQHGTIDYRRGGPPQRQFGLCPQQNQLWPHLSCAEQLRLLGRMYGYPADDIERRVDDLLRQFQLSSKRRTLGAELSGGMKRRLSLAMALFDDPPIIFIDEVDAGLDPRSLVSLRSHLRELASEGGKAIVMATHSLDEVQRIADRVLLLHRGQIIADGTPEHLIADQQLPSGIRFRLVAGDTTSPSLDAFRDELRREFEKEQSTTEPNDLQERGDHVRITTVRPAAVLNAIYAVAHRRDLEVTKLRISPGDLEDVVLQLTAPEGSHERP